MRNSSLRLWLGLWLLGGSPGALAMDPIEACLAGHKDDPVLVTDLCLAEAAGKTAGQLDEAFRKALQELGDHPDGNAVRLLRLSQEHFEEYRAAQCALVHATDPSGTVAINRSACRIDMNLRRIDELDRPRRWYP